jgi:hypothetical protein
VAFVTANGRVERLIGIVLAAIGWSALVVQLWLMVHDSPRPGHATANFFSFFTIETNIIVAIVVTMGVAGRRVSASVRGAAATYIAVVGIVYAVLLRNLWNPTGLQKVADVMLHDVVPVLYLLQWAAFGRRGALRFGMGVQWLVFPLAYFAYTLARGAATSWYPYPFVDVSKLGYPRVLFNAVGLIVFFLIVSSIVVVIDRFPGGRQVETAQ